ncbi:hypothetical protein [Ectopseudomonas khazarica]|uniref:hypothetical protein n=1 Tax=Ectopseudomonas khazarica TaxID=2502979 RepID=UPI003B927FC1
MNEWRTVFHHNSYHMRSYSETRWAAMLDALGIAWLYEPKQVLTRHGIYKPDFYLPNANLYLEVKGPHPTSIEIEKAHDLQETTGIPVFFSHGRPTFFDGELRGGIISYFSNNLAVRFTTARLGQLIKSHLDDKTYWSYIYNGRHTASPPYINAGSVATSYLSSLLSRAQLEQYLETQHKPLNAIKSLNQNPAGNIEKALQYAGSKLKNAQLIEMLCYGRLGSKSFFSSK